jgi:hypothetical protein
MKLNHKIPIKRLNKFFSEEDYLYEVSMGREVFEGDNNFTVVLFQVDKNSSNFDDIYGETISSEVVFLPPVEINVIPTLEESENTSYNNNGSLRYLEDGNLSFFVYVEHLKDLGIDINYGDYIGYMVDEENIRYFSVADDGKKNYNNEVTIMGYKPYLRTILCVPANKDEFKG